jgi:hypothetical protein
MMTMTEVCEHVKNQRKANAIHRNAIVLIDGECKGLTDKEYRSTKTKARGAGSKGRSYSHTKLWNHFNVPIEKFAN